MTQRTTHVILPVAIGGPTPTPASRRRPFGMHLVIDLFGCNSHVITNGEALATYVAQAVELLKMKPYGDCVIEHFGHAKPETSGYTAVQLIETSNLNVVVIQPGVQGHFVDDDGEAHLDLFSCQEFDPGAALAHAEEYFRAEESVSGVLYR